MKNFNLKKLLALMLALAMLVTGMPVLALASEADDTSASQQDQAEDTQLNLLSADADSPTGVFVNVGKSKVTIRINRVGTSGTAQLVRYAANEYFTGDKLTGMSERISASGDVLGEYTCGTDVEFSANRYLSDGTDTLYSKYYLIQDGKILAGPYYATQIASLRSKPAFETGTKKGLCLEDDKTIYQAIDMGVGNTVINMDMCDLILANEDANGVFIDNSQAEDVIEFESNGETFYFNANYVKYQDGLISAYSKAGMNVTLVVISWAKTYTKSYPSALMYLDPYENRHTMAFNTSNERGLKYWVAAMEFMAERYSRSSSYGLVNKFVISNEIDYTYDWNLIIPLQDENGKYQRADFDVFMEEYSRALRLADLAVKKYNSEAKVMVSLTHNWAMNCYDSYNMNYRDPRNAIRYNSYAPKDILDWLSKHEKARGDYNWGIAQHPYAIGTTAPNPIKTDPNWSGAPGVALPITGDVNTTPWITVSNLEVLQQYLEMPQNRYGDEIRSVSLTEASVLSKAEGAADYLVSTYQQAASIAMMYYRAAQLSCIEEVAYFELTDRADLKLGLVRDDGTEKPAYNVWKYIDTNKTYNYANRYLKYIDDEAETYRDVMEVVKTGFDWDTYWDEDNIITRIISTEEVERTLNTNKEIYGAGEAIVVTATGDIGDTVGLYKVNDNPETVDAIYSYPVAGSRGNLKFKSGNGYDILTYGEISLGRFNEAGLKAGTYKLVLTRGDTGETITKNIAVSEDYKLGTTTLSMTTNKTVYAAGEDIIVTATGHNDCWVGLYKKGDVFGPGEVQSIYWYWVNYPDAGQLSGKPTVIQSTQHNTESSNPGARLKAGEYVLYLFGSTGYDMVQSIEITIEPSTVDPLKSITYKLDNDTDGFANGVVTVTKDANNDNATDCVMYWADENGKPLEGYTALGRFKLNDTKTIQYMTEYTLIPEGARKLIAFASDGDSLSEAYVSVDLPENCGYVFDEEPLVEFQVVSDIHIPNEGGGGGETKLSYQHLQQMLEDVDVYSPESIGIFVSGDIADSGRESQYLRVYNVYQEMVNEKGATLPYMHLAVGNHDWMAGNPNRQFQKFVKIFNPALPEQPENIYYDEVVNGYHFIYLGGEKNNLHAVLSAEQIDWFDQRMAEITAEDPDKPVFVLLHQSFYNTVSGSLPGEGWDGIANETALRRVMRKYGQIIFLNGHSHWEMDSDSCMYEGDAELPVAFNTASVSYLWTGYNITSGEHQDGSQGYYVRVYEDKVMVIGRDFENNLFLPSALFIVNRNDITTDQEVYNVSVDGDAVSIEVEAENDAMISFASSNSEIASVTDDGTIIAKREGEVTITITAEPTDTTVITKKQVTVRIGDASVYRIYGNNRIETAIEIAGASKGYLGMEKYDTIILAYGLNFADALSGSYLSFVNDAPILLATDTTAKSVRAYVQNNLNPGGTVYILGGTKVMPDSIANGLINCTVERISGDNRFLTNLQILEKAGVTGGEILVCTGSNYADSLSASAAKKPILLVHTALTQEQKEFLAGLQDVKFTIVGGDKAVSAQVAEELAVYGEVERINGANRFETSVKVAERYCQNADSAVLAYALNYPDGLCGGFLATSLDAPLLLISNGYENLAAEYLKKNGIQSGFVLGGSGLISDVTTRNAFGLEPTVNIVTW